MRLEGMVEERRGRDVPQQPTSFPHQSLDMSNPTTTTRAAAPIMMRSRRFNRDAYHAP